MTAFGMIDARIVLGDPARCRIEEDVPGEPRPIRAVLARRDEALGRRSSGHLPATRGWEPADQDLLELFASEVAVAIRNAELFERVEQQHRALVELDAGEGRVPARRQPQPPDAADEHPRLRRAAGRGAAGPPAGDHRRAGRPAVTASSASSSSVSRLESGTLRPAKRGRSRSRPASGAPGRRSAPRPSRSSSWTRPPGWLAIADPDQLDQVLWALLDNSARYAGGAPMRARVAPRPDERLARASPSPTTGRA